MVIKEACDMFLERYLASTMFSDQERMDLKTYTSKNDGYCRFSFDPDYECCVMRFNDGNSSKIVVHVTDDGYSIKIDGGRTQELRRWGDVMKVIEET